MTEEDVVTERRDCEQAVMAAAREERAAHAALREGIKPIHPGRTESDQMKPVLRVGATRHAPLSMR